MFIHLQNVLMPHETEINRWAASAILTVVEIEHKVDWGFCFLVFFLLPSFSYLAFNTMSCN